MITDNLSGVICGNSDILLDQLIQKGVHFDLILTDPPYNINKDFGNQSDCLPLDEFIKITSERMAKVKKLLTPYGSVIWFGIHDYIGFVQVAMYNTGLYYRRMNIWHYENGFSRSKKEPATHYEPFLWFSNDKKKWTYNVRFFKAALFSLEDLDGIMYKHELCLGPMSINDLDYEQYKRMITYLKRLRGSYARYQAAYQELCDRLQVKSTLPDNSTRLPIAFMKTCSWIVSERTRSLYPPKSLECLRLTEHGKEVAASLHSVKDLRLDEYYTYPTETRKALIRLGVYESPKRTMIMSVNRLALQRQTLIGFK